MKKKILVVDDIERNRYMLRALLEGYGYEVSEAEDGIQALEIARQDLPDAVISDLLMPGMDGFAFCREWMSDEGLNRVPFIVFTATYTEPKDRDLALDIGAADFLIKPAEPDVIIGSLHKVFDKVHTPLGAHHEFLANGDFYERYSDRLKEKLSRKIKQLEITGKSLVDYFTRCEAILDASPSAIISLDCDMKIRSWNFSAERLLGYAESEIIGSPLDMLIPPDCKEEAQRMLIEVRERKENIRYECQRLRKDGTMVDVAISLSFLGPEIGFLGILSDLSEIRKAAAEKDKLEKQLALSQRMESVGLLAGGVAHDFNNLLTIILAHAGFIESDLKTGDQHREDANRILEAGARAASLTRQLLAFSRRQNARPEVLDLNDTVRAMEKMLKRLIGENINFTVRLAPDLGRIEADVSQLEQVIVNLAVNARDAMPDCGSLLIETRNAEINGKEALALAPIHPGRFVIMTVTDNGKGMDEQVQAQVFDPFFTTKERGKGTGLGLATVYGIIKQSKGFIFIDSKLGEGASFKIYWPRVDGIPASQVPDTVRKETRGQGETILIVEDEDLIRKLARRILERAGYDIIEARAGSEALTLGEKGKGHIDLLLTDVIMPNMNGHELARRMLKLMPSLKVVFTSGYTDDTISRHGVLNQGVSLVKKPFSAKTLTETVRAVLDGIEPGGIGEEQSN